MRKLVGTNENHPEGYLMGRKVDMGGDDWNGGEYTVTGLQSGTAILTRADGFRRQADIDDFRE